MIWRTNTPVWKVEAMLQMCSLGAHFTETFFCNKEWTDGNNFLNTLRYWTPAEAYNLRVWNMLTCHTTARKVLSSQMFHCIWQLNTYITFKTHFYSSFTTKKLEPAFEYFRHNLGFPDFNSYFSLFLCIQTFKKA